MRNQRKKNQQRQGMDPPVRSSGGGSFRHHKREQVSEHEGEDQQGDKAGFDRHFRAQPDWPQHQAPKRQPSDGDGYGNREQGHEVAIGADRGVSRGQKIEADSSRQVSDRNQGECAESPEHEGVRDSGQRPLTDHFPLQQNFPNEFRDARASGAEVKVSVSFGAANGGHNRTETPPKYIQRNHQQDEK
jgi:hypothetical protein